MPTSQKKKKKNQSKPRQERAAVARDTMEIVKRGFYYVSATSDDMSATGPNNSSSQKVSIEKQVQSAKAATILYDATTGELPQLPEKTRFDAPCEIQVTRETTIAAALRLSSETHHNDGDAALATSSTTNSHGNKIGCLNFASAKNPGGGFWSGSQAQEEALARASALVPCLETQFGRFYARHRQNKSPLYLDLAICSPAVPFFRNDNNLDNNHELSLLPRPFLCTVISCAAPNAGAVLRAAADRSADRGHHPQAHNDDNQVRLEIDAALKRRSQLVLHCAIRHEIDSLVLGAWGCGVFGNRPERIAEIFAEWLQKKEYSHNLKQVVFAIYDASDDSENYKAFVDVLTGDK